MPVHPPKYHPGQSAGTVVCNFPPMPCEAISLNGLFNFDQFSESRSFILLYYLGRFLCQGKSPQL
jgi:hypothetical protein